MELPRIASHTSICPPSLQLLASFPTSSSSPTASRPRTPAAARRILLSERGQLQQAEPQFAQLPSQPQYQPSRKREEAEALRNLRRRLQAVRVLQANRAEPVEARSGNNNLSAADLDNRPQLLQKILMNRPVSMVLDISDLTTAWKDSDFITDCLCWHNVYRERHASPPLTMSSELCHLAQTWANHLAHTNRFYYRNDKDIGQNLFCSPANAIDNEVTGQEVSTYWYKAVRQYDFHKEPDVLHANVNAGPFTQLVWVSTRHLGIGKARSRSGKIVVVAHYAPAGNISGAYLQNALPPTAEYFKIPAAPSARFLAATDNSGGGSRSSTTSGSGRSIISEST